jgi:RNA polymerase sigma-70 factor (ECF subfamily)
LACCAFATRQGWVDDIAQEAFLTAYRQWETFDQSRDFGKWIRGIAFNIIRNETRKDARRKRILHTDITWMLLKRFEESPKKSELVSVDSIRECLDELAPMSRTLIQGRYQNEETSSELAERLGLSATNVRQILMRARRHIRKCIELRVLQETRS